MEAPAEAHPETDSARAVADEAPWSIRACDVLIGAFAIWTLLCHAVVYLEGGFDDLLRAAGGVAILAAGALVARLFRRTETDEDRGSEENVRPKLASAARSDFWLAIGGALLLAAGFVAQLPLTLMWWLCGIYLVCALVRVLRNEPDPLLPVAGSWWREVVLWGLAVVCAVVPLFAHTVSPDDGYGVNVAVAALDHPDAPLLRDDTIHGKPDVPIMLSAYRLNSFELLTAAIARISGLSAIEAVHWATPALFGLFLPLAYARLFRVILPGAWLAATAVSVASLLLLHETQQSFASFSVWRMQQGKAVFGSVAIPLLIVYGLRFASRPSVASWIWLAAAKIASVGMTATALWAGPLVAAFALASAAPLSWRGMRRVVVGLCSSAYVVVAGLLVFQSAYVQNQTWEAPGGGIQLVTPTGQGIRDGDTLVAAAYETVLGNGRLAAFTLFALLCAWGLAPTSIGRRLFLVFPLGVLLLALDPYTSMWVASHVTGGPTYWRALWLLPIPAAIAVVLCAPLVRPGLNFVSRGALFALLCAAFFFFVPSYERLLTPRRVLLGFGILKVYPEVFDAAQAMRDHVPAGSFVLAPGKLSTWIVTLHDHPYPLVVRPDYLMLLRDRIPEKEIERRIRLTRFVEGRPTPGGLQALRRAVDDIPLSGVAFARRHPQANGIRRILPSLGFEPVYAQGSYEVWTRSAAE